MLTSVGPTWPTDNGDKAHPKSFWFLLDHLPKETRRQAKKSGWKWIPAGFRRLNNQYLTVQP
jgi:hypothetical protein